MGVLEAGQRAGLRRGRGRGSWPLRGHHQTGWGSRSLRATIFPIGGISTLNTSPMPPRPRRPRTMYLPRRFIPQPVRMLRGHAGRNDFGGGGLSVIGNAADVQGAFSRVPYHVFRPGVPVSGLAHAADVDQILQGRVERVGAFVEGDVRKLAPS